MHTCWRIEQADRVALIVDAADYFRAAQSAMLKAQHSILMIGWDFDTRIDLDPTDGTGEYPESAGSVPDVACRNQAGSSRQHPEVGPRHGEGPVAGHNPLPGGPMGFA